MTDAPKKPSVPLQQFMFFSLPGKGRRIAFEYPTWATENEIQAAKDVIALQIKGWERWNKERRQKIVDDFFAPIIETHYNRGYP